MKGLLIKDFKLLTKTSIMFLLLGLVVIYILLGLVMEHNFTGFSGLIILICSMLSITTFSYDSQDGFNNYLFTLPVTKKEAVLSKYIITILITAFGLLVGLGYSYIMAFIKSYNIPMDEIYYNLACFEIALIFICILLPIIYKFGVEKARILLVSFVVLPFIGNLAIEKLGIEITEQMIDNLFKILPLITILIIIISYFVSISIYKKKGINDTEMVDCFSKNFN